MLKKIMIQTNNFIHQANKKFRTMTAALQPLCFNGLYDLLSVLIFSGAQHDNQPRSDEMFHIKFGHAFYRSAPSEKRFIFY